MVTRRSISVLSMLVVGALTVAGCGGSESTELNKVTISVGVDPAYTPDFVAKQQGFFEKHGLDATLVQYSPAGDGVDAMIAGTVNIGAAGDANSLIKSTRGGLAALSVYETSGKYMKLVVRNDINSPMEIRKMGVTSGSLVEYGAIKVLEEAGDLDAVELVNAGVSEFPALLQRGAIDAFLAYEPFVSQAETQNGKTLGPSDQWGFSYSFLVNANAQWLKENAATAEAYLDAIAEAAEFIKENPEKAADAVHAEAKMPAKDALKALGDVDFNVRDFSAADHEAFEQISEYLVRTKTVEKAPDLEKYLRPGFFKG